MVDVANPGVNVNILNCLSLSSKCVDDLMSTPKNDEVSAFGFKMFRNTKCNGVKAARLSILMIIYPTIL